MKKSAPAPARVPDPASLKLNGWSDAALCIGLFLVLTGAVGLSVTDTLPAFVGPADKNPPSVDVVILDAGHGGYDTGASANTVVEKHLCLDVVHRVARHLDANGVRTRLTRDTDRFITLSERTKLRDREQRAIFVSVHFNQASNQTASGIETYYFSGEANTLASEDELLAERVQSHLVGLMQTPDRGVKSSGYYVLRHAQIPAILIEGGFVSNTPEARLLATPAWREKLARGIGEGILLYREELQQRAGIALAKKSG